MRKRPPPGKVRRVRPIGNNFRYEFISKDGAVVQAESLKERIKALVFERNKKVRRYRSQPFIITYETENGAKINYTPDYEVEMIDEAIEIHEVTLSERREKESAKRREAAALQDYQAKGSKYIVDTEEMMPNPTETTNLYTLYQKI